MIYSSTDMLYFMIYANNVRSESEAVFDAIQDTRLPYRIADGYNGSVRTVYVEGFDGIEVVLPADFFPPPKQITQNFTFCTGSKDSLPGLERSGRRFFVVDMPAQGAQP